MSRLGFIRRVGVVALVSLSACVIRLADRNSPIPNGGVTGEPANCGAIPIEPRAAEGQTPEYRYVGRFVFLDQKDANGQPYARFDWSGNQISARFMGSEVSFTVLDHENDLLFQPIIDGEIVPSDYPAGMRLYTTRLDGRSKYLIKSGLDPNVPHEVILHRNSEAQGARVTFAGFDFGPGGRLLPPKIRARKIEIIGDSITCGYGNEGGNATCPFDVVLEQVPLKNPDGTPVLNPDGTPKMRDVKLPVTENNYKAYGSIAGRELDAEVTTLCWSGKGVNLNYKERGCTAPEPDCAQNVPLPGGGLADIDGKVVVPDLYDRRFASLNLNPSAVAEANPKVVANAIAALEAEKRLIAPVEIGPYDFSKERPEEQPQVVLIHLGTNDYARDQVTNATGETSYDLTTGFPGDNIPDQTIQTRGGERDAFLNRTRQLVVDVRARRPNAHIMIAVPPMLTNQFPFEGARDDIRAAYMTVMNDFKAKGDNKVYVIEFVEQGLRYGLGCDYHPNLEVHRIMADQFIGAVRSKTCWN